MCSARDKGALYGQEFFTAVGAGTEPLQRREGAEMFIKKLTLEHFGQFEYKSFNFCDSLNVIAGEDTRAVFAALCVALCNRLLRFQISPYCFMESSRIYAEIEAGGADYVSETVYRADAPEHCETNVYRGGRKLTEEERRAVFHVSAEEEECSYFINRYDYRRYIPFAELDYSKKLAEYRKALREEDRQNFSERTDGAGNTHTFRRELKKFCDAFLPRQIRLEKRLWLTMDEDGSFSVKDTMPRRDLSETEEVLLQYFCFLEVNRFWDDVQKTMGRTVKKPLFIGALTEHIDFCVDLTQLLEQTLEMNRQVFLFTGDKKIENRLNRMSEGESK